ncbi:MAG TPA: hypothetical protein VHL58_04000 [Thermoanaerobaculia bacterium]|nr:hypothetical protein [Thermoanaerobaculia bacterium]
MSLLWSLTILAVLSSNPTFVPWFSDRGVAVQALRRALGLPIVKK